MERNIIITMIELKTLSVSVLVFLLTLNFSAASLFFLDVEGEVITSETMNEQFTTPFTARYLVNTDAEGLGFEDLSTDFDDTQQLNSFPGAIESFQFQILGNSSFFFDDLDEGSLDFQRVPSLGRDFLIVNAASRAADVFEFDLVLFYDEGLFGDGPFEFNSLLEEATPLSSTNQPQVSLLFADLRGPDFGLDFDRSEGNLGMGIISEVTLSPVPEPSQLGLACLSFCFLSVRRKRARQN